MARIGVGDCRRFASVYLSTMDPELAASAVGMTDGTAILGTDEVEQELYERRAILRRQLQPEDVARALAALAFGRCNDCVKLALEDAPAIDKLDLRLLSEIKRNDKGTVEIKLIDRLAALEQLSRITANDEETATAFLDAMRAACEAS